MFQQVFHNSEGMSSKSSGTLSTPKVVLYYFIPPKDEKIFTASTGGHIALEIINGSENIYFSPVAGKDKDAPQTFIETIFNSVAQSLGIPKLIQKEGKFNEKEGDLSRVTAGRNIVVVPTLPASADLEKYKGKFIYCDPKFFFINADKADKKISVAQPVAIDFISQFRRNLNDLKVKQDKANLKAEEEFELSLTPDEIKELITQNGGFVPPVYIGYKRVVLEGEKFNIPQMLKKIQEYKDQGYEYNFWQNNCADIVFDILKAGGISAISEKQGVQLQAILNFVLPQHLFECMNTISHVCIAPPKSKQDKAEKPEEISSANISQVLHFQNKDPEKTNPIVHNSISDPQKASSDALMNPAKKDPEKLMSKSLILQTAKNNLKLQENDNSYFMFKRLRAAFFGVVTGFVLGPWVGVGVFALLAAPSIYEKIKNAKAASDDKDTSKTGISKQDGVE